MKFTKLPFLLISLFISTLFSINANAHTLVLTVDKIVKVKGVIMVALYNSETGYNSDQGTFSGEKVAVTGKNIKVKFDNVPDGNYAIKLFQDENENGSIDKNLLGIPSEGYGFSNNGGGMGQPSFNEAKFTIKSDTNIIDHLR
jgi:uncharacterized protein (DUF2141 family)